MTLKLRLVRNFLSIRILLVGICVLLIFALFSGTRIMQAQANAPRMLAGDRFGPNGCVKRSVQQLSGENTTFKSYAPLRVMQTDKTPPVVTIQQPANGTITSATKVAVSGTYSDDSQTTITVNGAAATLSGNNFTATVPVTEGANKILVHAVDAAGNASDVVCTIIRDTIPPTVTIQQPRNGTLTAETEITVSGTFSDANAVRVIVNGVSATLTQDSFTARVPLNVGRLLLFAHAIDAAGNETEVEHQITVAGALNLNVEEPKEGLIEDYGEIHVAGVVSGTDVQVTVNGQPLSMAGGTVFGGYITLPEGTGRLRIKATDILGRTKETIRNVVVDTTPPIITEVVPRENQLVTETFTTVTGRVTDATEVTVTVNDKDASVGANGVFTLANVAVSEKENSIRIEATDAVRNNSRVDLVFLGRDRTPPTAPVLFPVSMETRLQAQQIEGRAEPGTLVNITGGTQPITAQASDGTGLFFASVDLAAGNNLLAITNVDKGGNVSPPVSLTVRSSPGLTRPVGQPFQIHVSTNDAQKGLIGQELPRPLIVRVTDQAGAPIGGVAVTYKVIFGGGRFVGGGNQIVATTDDHGRASARYIGGSAGGFQYIRADFPNNPTKPVSFGAELIYSAPGTKTSASGFVMDQFFRALPNVLVRLAGHQTRTDADGKFLLDDLQPGPHQTLELIGRDQIQSPGRWSNISYHLDLLAGVNNHLGRPLFLPRVNGGVSMPLDAHNIIRRDTVYELPGSGGLPPIRLTARAGTHVRFSLDVTDKRLSVTRIPIDRTPLELEDGRAASLYISVQPSGAIFEQPLEISFPNLDRLQANEKVLLLSFDDNAGRYVQVGTGHVSADARVVRSDPDSGIRVGGLHAFPPDPPQKELTVLSELVIEGNPALEGRDIEVTSAVVLSSRSVSYSSPNASGRPWSKILLRSLVVQPANGQPVTATSRPQPVPQFIENRISSCRGRGGVQLSRRLLEADIENHRRRESDNLGRSFYCREAFPTLKEFALDPDPNIRKEITFHLGVHHSTEALQSLVQQIERYSSEKDGSPAVYAAQYPCHFFRGIKSRLLTQALAAGIKSWHDRFQSEVIYLLGCLSPEDARARRVLEELNQPSSAPRLGEDDTLVFQGLVTDALAEAGSNEAEEQVLTKIETGDPSQIQSRLEALKGFTNCRILLRYAQFITDKRDGPEAELNPEARMIAQLGSIGPVEIRTVRLRLGDLAISSFTYALGTKVTGEKDNQWRPHTDAEMERIYQRVKRVVDSGKFSRCSSAK